MITETAEQYRQKAIALLLEERQAIDSSLAALNYDGAAPVKKSHKKKDPAEISGAEWVSGSTHTRVEGAERRETTSLFTPEA